MVLSKDKKVLYQVLMPEKTVTIPEKVSRIASYAVNAWNFPRIRQISNQYSLVGEYINKLVVPDTLQGLSKHKYGRITGSVDLDHPQRIKGGKILYSKKDS